MSGYFCYLNLFKIFTPLQNSGEIGKVLNRIFTDSPNIAGGSLAAAVLIAIEVLPPGGRRIELGAAPIPAIFK